MLSIWLLLICSVPLALGQTVYIVMFGTRTETATLNPTCDPSFAQNTFNNVSTIAASLGLTLIDSQKMSLSFDLAINAQGLICRYSTKWCDDYYPKNVAGGGCYSFGFGFKTVSEQFYYHFYSPVTRTDLGLPIETQLKSRLIIDSGVVAVSQCDVNVAGCLYTTSSPAIQAISGTTANPASTSNTSTPTTITATTTATSTLATSSTTGPTTTSDSGSSNDGAIAGGVIGGVAAVALAGVGIAFATGAIGASSAAAGGSAAASGAAAAGGKSSAGSAMAGKGAAAAKGGGGNAGKSAAGSAAAGKGAAGKFGAGNAGISASDVPGHAARYLF